MSEMLLDDHRPVWSCVPGESAVGDCVAIERLGVGHRCETWLAWSVGTWAPVVLKLARPDQVAHPRARATLQREVTCLAGTVHPSLPRLVGAHLDHETPHVVTEYVDGPTLADLVDEDGALSSVEVALLGTQLLSALTQLHRRGLAHLDVKPENVVLRDGRPVLIDFGSARQLASKQPAGSPVGTFGYAAPEMEACEPVSVAMDLFGLGAILAESIIGQPYPDAPALPETSVSSTVERLLSPDPSHRGTTAEIMLSLAACCGTDRPWPRWADRYLTTDSGPADLKSRPEPGE